MWRGKVLGEDCGFLGYLTSLNEGAKLVMVVERTTPTQLVAYLLNRSEDGDLSMRLQFALWKAMGGRGVVFTIRAFVSRIIAS